jgi:hypothetical protein
MADQVFTPNVQKTATVPVTVVPAGLACTIEVFLGVTDTNPVATSGKLAFTSTGAVQNLACPIRMPATGGTYNTYVNVMYGTAMIVGFVGTDHVIIATGVIGPPVWT